MFHAMEESHNNFAQSAVCSLPELLNKRFGDNEYCHPIQKVSCADHQIHHRACASCAAMESFFGSADTEAPLLTTAGDAVRVLERQGGGALLAVVKPRGCPGARLPPMRVVRAPPDARGGSLVAHVVPCSGLGDERAVLYLGRAGLPGGGGGSSKVHRCESEITYKCRDCGFVCPNEACVECCTHKNHTCLEQKKEKLEATAFKEDKSAEFKSKIAADIKKEVDSLREIAQSVCNEKQSDCERTSIYKSDQSSFLMCEGVPSINTGETLSNDMFSDSDVRFTHDGLLPNNKSNSVPVLRFPKWKDLLTKKVNYNIQNKKIKFSSQEVATDHFGDEGWCNITTEQSVPFHGTEDKEKDLLYTILHECPSDQLSKERFFNLYKELQDLSFGESVMIKVLTWCQYHMKMSGMLLASVCDFLKMLIEINDADIFGDLGDNAYFQIKEQWLKKYDIVSDERNEIIQSLAWTQWSPDVCELFQKSIINILSLKPLRDFVSLVQMYNVPDAIILFALTHFPGKEINKIKLWERLVHYQILLNRSNLDTTTIIKISPPLFKLIEISLPHTLLCDILSDKADEINKYSNEFIQTLEILIDYRISPEMIEKIMRQLCLSESVKNWPQIADRSVIRDTFKDSRKNTDNLISLLKDLNSNISEDLESMCEKVYTSFKNPIGIKTKDPELQKLGIFINPIKTWKTTDVKVWAKLITGKVIPERLDETVAVLMRAVNLHYGYKINVRRVQVLALLILLEPNDKGRLAQINTGEGKSMLVAMLAAVHALRGKNVDVVTTAADLAEREVRNTEGFFEMLTLTVAENTTEKGGDEGQARAYACNVVYGTAVHFIGDVLRQECLGNTVRGKRGFDVVFVDEVDSLFFDGCSYSVRLAQNIPSMNYLEPVLGAIWESVHRLAGQLVVAHNGKTYFAQDAQESEWLKKHAGKDEKEREIKDPKEFIITKTILHAKDLIRSLDDEQREEYLEFQAIERELYERRIKAKDDNNAKEPKCEEQKEKDKDKRKTRKDDNKPQCEDEENEETDNRREKNEEKDKNSEEETLAKNQKEHELESESKTTESEEDKLKKKFDALPWFTKERRPVIPIPEHLREFAMSQIHYWVTNAVNVVELYRKNAHYTVKNDRIVPISYDENGELQMNLIWSDGLTQYLQIQEGLPMSAETISTNFLSNVSYFFRYDNNVYGVTGTIGDKSTQNFLVDTYNVVLFIIPPFSYRPIVHNLGFPYLSKELEPLILPSYDDWFECVLIHALHHASMGRAVLVICRFVQETKKLATILRKRHSSGKVFQYTGEEPFQKYDLDSGDVVFATNIAGRGTDFKPSQRVDARGGLYVLVSFLPQSLRVEMQNIGRTSRQGNKGLAQFILHAPPPADIETLREQRKKKETQGSELAKKGVKRVLIQDRLFGAFRALESRLLPTHRECELEAQWPTLKSARDNYLRGKRTSIKQKLLEYRSNARENLQQKIDCRVSRAGEIAFSSNDALKELHQELDTEMPEVEKRLVKKHLETFCKTQECKYPPLLINHLLEGTEYTPVKSDLCEKNGWGIFERLALEERFGLWLRGKHFESGNDFESALKQFQKDFEAVIEKEAKENKLIQNPFYYVKKGNAIYSLAMSFPLRAVRRRENLLEKAGECYDKAIKLDVDFSAHARFNKACVLLSYKKNSGERQNNAYIELIKAKESIEHTLKPCLLSFCSLLAVTGTKVGTVRHIQHQLNILEQEIHFIDEAMKVLKKTERHIDGQHLSVKLTTIPVSKALEVCVENHSLAVQEEMDNGLVHFFSIKEVPPVAWGSVIGLAAIAIVQIAIGGVITAITGGLFGVGLIVEGVSDIILAITCGFTGGVHWGTWVITKACSLALSIISCGSTVVAKGFGALKFAVEAIQASKFHSIIVAIKTAWLGMKTSFQNTSPTANCFTELENWRNDMRLCENVEETMISSIKRIMNEIIPNNDLFKAVVYIDEQEKNSTWQDILVNEAMKLYQVGKYSVEGKELQVQFLRELERLRNDPNDTASLPDDLIQKLISFTQEFVKDFDSKVTIKYKDEIMRQKTLHEEANARARGTENFRVETFAPGPIASASSAESQGSPPASDGEDAAVALDLSDRVGSAVCQRLWHGARAQWFVRRRPALSADATSDVIRESDRFREELQRQFKDDVYAEAAPAPSAPAPSAPPDPEEPKLSSAARKAVRHISITPHLNAGTVHFLARAMGRDVMLVEAGSGRLVLRAGVEAPEKPVMLRVDERGCTPMTVQGFQRSPIYHDLLRAALAEGGSALNDALGGEEGLRKAMVDEIVNNPLIANLEFME